MARAIRNGKTVGDINGGWAWMFRLAQVLIPIVLAVQAFTLNRLWNQSENIAQLMQWSRAADTGMFRKEDGLALKVELLAEIAKLREELTEMRTDFTAQDTELWKAMRLQPPEWVRDDIEKLKTELQGLKLENATRKGKTP